MSPARRTSARRRMKRYRAKRTWKTIPERLKRLIVEPPEHMPTLWEEKAVLFVDCEEPTIDELQTKGVPEAEWPYYLGYMKRMCSLYRTFTGATLLSEKESLIAEYVLRGYSEHVLEQVQEVAAICAFVPSEPIGTFEFLEYWNFGPPSDLSLEKFEQHFENWNWPNIPTLTLLHSEPWSA